jgi:hypothetical protein
VKAALREQLARRGQQAGLRLRLLRFRHETDV